MTLPTAAAPEQSDVTDALLDAPVRWTVGDMWGFQGRQCHGTAARTAAGASCQQD